MIKSSSRLMAGLALALCSMVAAALLATAAPALAESCPNEEFRTGPGVSLPDCRAYELVTPPFKEAATAALERHGFGQLAGLTSMSADGLRVDLNSTGDFGDVQNGLFLNNYQLTRGESGWSERSIDLPASQFPAGVAVATTPELEATLYEARSTTQSIQAKDFWLREADGALRDIGPFEPPAATEGPPGPGEGAVDDENNRANFIMASEDLSHILFTSPVPWPGDEASGSIYEYTVGQSGPPVPVGIEPDGSPCVAHILENEGEGGMSANGSTVFFNCSGQIFARIDNGEADARTVAVSTGPATFAAASPDGGVVFYTESEVLYRFDVPSATREEVGPASAGDWGSGGAQVQNVERVSEDGSHVYFVARGELQGAVNSQGQSPKEGQENLYVFDSETGAMAFIATITVEGGECLGLHGFNFRGCNTAVTPDGQFFVFTNSADLTPGDTSTAVQVFEYDAQTGSLVRVSIGQNGFNDDGNTDTFNAEIDSQLHGLNSGNMPLAVSNNGAYVVFQSADGLTPGALNGYLGEVEFENRSEQKVKKSYYANNIYEYHDGEVYLISDGQDTSDQGEGHSAVQVRGLSPSGNNIFFETADRLVPQDLDTQEDLYDARVDGGFPAPVSLLPSCTGDACQGLLTPSPVLLSPGSEFQAGGNPPLTAAEPAPASKSKPKTKPRACKKGYLKTKNKCVKKSKAKSKAKKASNDRRVKS